jgi:hypothetical protein
VKVWQQFGVFPIGTFPLSSYLVVNQLLYIASKSAYNQNSTECNTYLRF